MTIPEEIEQLKTQLSFATDVAVQAEILIRMLKEFAFLSYRDSGEYIDRLAELAVSAGSDLYMAWALYHRACDLRMKGDYAASLGLSWQAHDLFLAAGNQNGMANCQNNIGLAHNQLGNYTEALKSYVPAFQFKKEIGDKLAMGGMLNNIGLVHFNLGNYAEALKNYLGSIEIKEDAGDKRGIANSYGNIGYLYFMKGDHPEALKNHLSSLRIKEEIGDKQGTANSLNNIGLVHFHLGDYEEAMRNYLSSLQIKEEIGDKRGMGNSYANIADIHRERGDQAEALKFFALSRRIKEETGDKQGIAMSYGSIGLIHYMLGDFGQAAQNQAEALRISEDIQYKEGIRSYCLALTDTCRASGDFQNALRYYQKYHQVQNEMLGEQAQKDFAQINFRHNMELKEKEAVLLKQKNEEISVYAHKLEISNNELKQFAHMASHDLREPLRMVSSYMSLLEQSLGDRMSTIERQFIAFAVDGAGRMEGLIHDLLRLAKVDADLRIEDVPLAAVLGEVKNNLEVLIRERNAVITSDDLPAIRADRTQVMQLFQNLIGNGIKYNECSRPAIAVKYENTGTQVALRFADNGIGIPEQYRERAFQLFQRVPTEKKYSGTGIGLAICKKISEGMGGSIAIEDSTGGGTVFKIMLPTELIVDGYEGGTDTGKENKGYIS